MLPTVTAAECEAISRCLYITDHRSGARVRWEPNAEQLAAWYAAEDADVVIFKPRAIGISTSFDVADSIWTLRCDAEGHRVRCAVVLDTDDKAKERGKQMRDFLGQLGAEYDGDAHTIRFPRMGSEISLFSAGGKRPAASTQFQRVRFSEYAFYAEDAMAAMGPSIGLGARQIIETTVSSAGRNIQGAKQAWRAKNGFKKVFFPVELHAEYRHDPTSITEEEWARMRQEGYNDRASAAWFLRVGVDDKLKGDERRGWAEYPQLERHMFQSATGVVVQRAPGIAPVVAEIKVPGVAGDTWIVKVHRRLEDTSGALVAAVDTSEGIGLSRSGIVVTDKRDAQIVATFSSEYVKHDDLARVAQAIQEGFRPAHPKPGERHRRAPLMLVEKNGIGRSTITECERLGVEFEAITQTAESQEDCLVQAKRAIESGLTEGPPEMAEECDELVRDEHGNYRGRKDLLMCYGMTLVRRREDPYGEVDRTAKVNRMPEFAEALKEYQSGQGPKRPPWGY